MKVMQKPPRFSGGDNWMPHMAIMRAGLLLDDLVHRGVSKVADKVEKKNGFDRPSQVIAMSVGTGVADMPILAYTGKLGNLGEVMYLAFPVLFAAYKKVPDAVNFMLGTRFKDPVGALCKFMRFPTLVATATGIINQVDLPKILWLATSTIAFYLLSTSTGILDRVMDWTRAWLASGKAEVATVVNRRSETE